MKKLNPKYWLIKFLDWYVKTYHSQDYIHIDLIKDEIQNRIARAEARLNKERDERESTKIRALEIQHKINEDGWIAEIERMEKILEANSEWRNKVDILYHETVRRIKQLALINASNQHAGTEIINNVSASLGELDIVSREIIDFAKEVEAAKVKDTEILRIPSTLKKIKHG